MNDDLDDYLHRLLLLPEQASSLARQIDALHYAVIAATLLGAIVITLVAVIFCIRYRARDSQALHQRRAPAPTPPLWAEWSVITGLFALFVGFWGVGFWQYVQLAVAPEDALDIYVTAKQWMWKFSYPDGHNSIDQLYVPVGRPVRLILTSRDVIHSFYVPAFRTKQDAIPGRYSSLWFTARYAGTHQILCAEYCGTSHSRMRAQVIALAQADFARWLGDGEPEGEPRSNPGRAPSPATPQPMSMTQRGEQIAAERGCLRCHTLDGSPHIGPTWAGMYLSSVPLERGQPVVADASYLTESMMDPMAKIHRGFKPVMPSYLGLLQPGEVAAMLELIKSLAQVPSADGVAAGPQSALNPLPAPGTIALPVIAPQSHATPPTTGAAR